MSDRPTQTAHDDTISHPTHIDHRHAEQLETLAARASQGCHDALADLYEKTIDPLYRYLYLRTRDHHTTEDLTSETWLAAVRNIHTYRTRKGHGFTAWLFTIARNKLIDFHRSKVGARFTYNPPPEMVTWQAEPVVCGHTRECITTAIDKLPRRQRETVVLNDILGLTLAETAGVLGRREPAVRKAHSRAIVALRATLQECQTGGDHD